MTQFIMFSASLDKNKHNTNKTLEYTVHLCHYLSQTSATIKNKPTFCSISCKTARVMSEIKIESQKSKSSFMHVDSMTTL